MEVQKPRGVKQRLLIVHKKEIMNMRDAGYSYTQIANWLEGKGVLISSATVCRFIIKQTK
jgi:hypothetical protein